MSAATPVMQSNEGVEVRGKVVKRMAQIFGQVIVMGAVLFLAAWTFDWTWAWVYLGLIFGMLVIVTLLMLKSPAFQRIAAERSEVKEGTKRWDRILTAIMLIPGFGMYIIAGLDYRLGWSGAVPLAVHLIAAVVMMLAYGLLYWSMLTNAFFSTTVRIQTERGHTVVTDGPYRFVRHPGYVGIMLTALMAMLVLGSWWGVAVAGISAALYVIRTALEDRTLQAELPGYKEYAERTRYRLLPGIY